MGRTNWIETWSPKAKFTASNPLGVAINSEDLLDFMENDSGFVDMILQF
jgi:hypothetical protein